MKTEIKNIADELQLSSMAARDWVFQVIRTAIMRGILPGNMPLRQDEISDALNVSHIPVREAFRQLEAQGLVKIYPNRGAVVAALSEDEISNIMDVLFLMEKGALMAAMDNINDDDVNDAVVAYQSFFSEQEKSNFDRLNLRLHMTLYASSDNAILLSLIDQLHANADRYMQYAYMSKESAELLAQEHKAIVDAFVKRDKETAVLLLEKHFEHEKELMLNSPLVTG